MASHYAVPNWAGKPPIGLHLDVLKEDKLVQKLMIDEKRCYLFGRNTQLNDFGIDHASCSRVHAALVWHRHLLRAFLVDLGSTHGTYIGSIKLESHKPTQLPVDSEFHFGASTRKYILRERPQTASKPIMEELERTSEEADGALLGLPESETELDNLTEFNTAHNRRISMLGISDEDINTSIRRKKKLVITFNDEEEIINPEDVDPTVGRFRNLIHTTVIPVKKHRYEAVSDDPLISSDTNAHRHHFVFPTTPTPGLYAELPLEQSSEISLSSLFPSSLSSKLGMSLPNPAPDVDITPAAVEFIPPSINVTMDNSTEPRKKKYAKEAWPGKKSFPSLLV